MKVTVKRLTARKFFLTFFVIIGITLLLGTRHHRPNRSRVEPVPIENKDVPEKRFFLKNGTLYPSKSKVPARLFPEQSDEDRVIDQLMYVPEYYQGYDSPEKTILLFSELDSWGPMGSYETFHKCPVNRCTLTVDSNRAAEADAIVFKDQVVYLDVERPMNQVWILYHLECPYHTEPIKYPDSINWTATYRRDSDIAVVYGRWIYYDSKVRQQVQTKDYAANKTKKVAWFVSNCYARNNRLEYAWKLGKYIQVDIYGECGLLTCPRTKSKKCFNILKRDYKFYLAFENSNCRDYITEKMFVNGLGHDVLPIVMGARPEDYQKSAPEGSYIHVDEFASPEELAAYLHRLDEDNTLYNSYFKWKGTGEFINTYFWCRLCAMLHAPQVPRHYQDVNDWWRGPGICTTKSWRNTKFV